MITLTSFSSLATFFEIQYMIFISALIFSEALYFNEHKIIEFLKRFEKLYDEYKITVKKQ